MSDLFSSTHQGAHVSTESRASRRTSAHHHSAHRKQRRRRRWRAALVILVTAALVVGAGYLVRDTFESLFGNGDAEETVTDFPGPGTGEVEVVIPRGASGAAIGQTLVDEGVVATQEAFVDAIADYRATYGEPNLQYGTYSLQLEMSAADALLAMLDSANLVQNGVTVREGLNTNETIARLSSVTTIPVADFEAALEDTGALGLPESANGDVEGWLAPATYPYDDSTTAAQLLTTMIAKQISDLGALGVAEEDYMTVLTKASLVEKEAPADARAKVARVIENRLAIGQNLEFDSTIHFLVGGSADASTTAEQRATDSPYNTYRYAGLPPGPIANPGRAAIEAVMSPEEGDWLFFVTVNPLTGETKFARTYEEHLVNVAEYQQFLRDNATSDATEEDGGEG